MPVANLTSSEGERPYSLHNWLFERGLEESDLHSVNAIIRSTSVKFPITGPSGSWVFDVCRHFDSEHPRYVLEPASCRAGHTLYRYTEHQPLIKERDYVILVEGISDVLALSKMGLPALAVLGSRITGVQQELVSRLTDTVLVWADGDDAGRKLLDALPNDYMGMQVDNHDPASFFSSTAVPPGAVKDVYLYPGEYSMVVFSEDGQILECRTKENDDERLS